MFKKLYFFVYIMTNEHNYVLYIGVTNNIARRAWEHKEGTIKGFTEKYKLNKLVYYETHEDINAAIQREKQLKYWKRMWKIELIEKENPNWDDLYKTLN